MSVAVFLQGTGMDNNGRLLSDVLKQNDEWFEYEHNYIQWLFPLLEESQNVHDAPVLDLAEVEVIKGDPLALKNQRVALKRMEEFYLHNDHWLCTMDHNHLRITRILKSLRLLQSLVVTETFYNQLMERVKQSGNPIQVKNVAYWTDAVGLSYRD